MNIGIMVAKSYPDMGQLFSTLRRKIEQGGGKANIKDHTYHIINSDSQGDQEAIRWLKDAGANVVVIEAGRKDPDDDHLLEWWRASDRLYLFILANKHDTTTQMLEKCREAGKSWDLFVTH